MHAEALVAEKASIAVEGSLCHRTQAMVLDSLTEVKWSGRWHVGPDFHRQHHHMS